MNDPGTELVIRRFQQGDQGAVQWLILEGLSDHFQTIDVSLNPDLDDIASSYLEQGDEFIVVVQEGKIIGAGALINPGGRTGRIVRVSVARDCRRLGVGHAIVARLVELALQRSYEELVVETNHDWLEAIALYLRCGFIPYDRDEVSIHMRLALNSD